MQMRRKKSKSKFGKQQQKDSCLWWRQNFISSE